MRGRKAGSRVGPNHIYGANDRQRERMAAKLTQTELATHARVSERSVRTWEQGGCEPMLCRRIAMALATKTGTRGSKPAGLEAAATKPAKPAVVWPDGWVLNR